MKQWTIDELNELESKIKLTIDNNGNFIRHFGMYAGDKFTGAKYDDLLSIIIQLIESEAQIKNLESRLAGFYAAGYVF